jgi:hypothetical protein
MDLLPSIWNRLGNEWLVTKTACALFGASAVLVVVLTAGLSLLQGDMPGLLPNIFWGTIGVLGTAGAFFLWTGMWRYWMRIDSSRRAMRRIWFVLLVVGIWFGAILYYLLVYLPAVRRNLNASAGGPEE